MALQRSYLLSWLTALAAATRCPNPEEITANLTVGYDEFAHPGQLTGEPVQVEIMLFVASIVQVNQKDQQLAMEGYYRSAWTDPRLNLTQWPGCEALIIPTKSWPFWQPDAWRDIYFDNSVKEWYGAGGLTISPNGYVYRSERFSHVFGCPMSYSTLPFDKQTCVVRMSSYAYDVSNVAANIFQAGGVDLPADYKGTTEFALRPPYSRVQTEYYGVGANQKGYNFVLLYFELQRMPDSFMMFVFVTCILFTFVSWSGLFINRTVAPARVAIAVIPVLIMLNLETLRFRNNVISNLPPLNYLTWITSYLLLMKFFCLSAVFEYGLVSFLIQLETSRERQFEAFKHLAETVKKKAKEDHGGVSKEHSGKNMVTLCFFRPHSIRRRRCKEIDLQKKFHQVYRLFDRDNSGELSWKEVQAGFRRLGQYWSRDQVMELFYGLGIVGKGKRMTTADFKRFMMDIQKYLPGKAMNITFGERPPSYQVDLVFRWAYISGVLLVTFIYLISPSGAIPGRREALEKSLEAWKMVTFGAGEALEDLVPFAEDVPVTDLDFEDETEGEGFLWQPVDEEVAQRVNNMITTAPIFVVCALTGLGLLVFAIQLLRRLRRLRWMLRNEQVIAALRAGAATMDPVTFSSEGSTEEVYVSQRSSSTAEPMMPTLSASVNANAESEKESEAPPGQVQPTGREGLASGRPVGIAPEWALSSGLNVLNGSAMPGLAMKPHTMTSLRPGSSGEAVTLAPVLPKPGPALPVAGAGTWVGTGICDLRASLVAQQKQLDTLVDRVAVLLSSMHAEVLQDVRAACDSKDFELRLAEMRKVGEVLDQRLAEMRAEAANVPDGLRLMQSELRRVEEKMEIFDGRMTQDFEKLQGVVTESLMSVHDRFTSEMEGVVAELKKLEGRLGSAETERGNGVEREFQTYVVPYFDQNAARITALEDRLQREHTEMLAALHQTVAASGVQEGDRALQRDWAKRTKEDLRSGKRKAAWTGETPGQLIFSW
eukprot:g20434.t1